MTPSRKAWVAARLWLQAGPLSMGLVHGWDHRGLVHGWHHRGLVHGWDPLSTGPVHDWQHRGLTAVTFPQWPLLHSPLARLVFCGLLGYHADLE